MPCHQVDCETSTVVVRHLINALNGPDKPDEIQDQFFVFRMMNMGRSSAMRSLSFGLPQGSSRNLE